MALLMQIGACTTGFCGTPLRPLDGWSRSRPRAMHASAERRRRCRRPTFPGEEHGMNRITVACLAGFVMVLLSNSVPGADRHTRAELVAADGSGAIGWVEITQTPTDGATVHVFTEGLVPDGEYSAWYYETGDCSGPQDAMGSFRMDARGRGEAHVRITDDLEDLGSVSIRQGNEDGGRVVACASLR
jgi:hypothetical protein